MKVKDLRARLKGVPDNAEVLRTGGEDHTYVMIRSASEGAAGYDAEAQTYFEWYGEDNAGPDEVRVTALILD